MTVSAVFLRCFWRCINYFRIWRRTEIDHEWGGVSNAGLGGAVLSASSSVAREIRTGTALAVLSKPVGRAQFLLAKYVGLALALTVLTYVNCLAVLLATRMAFDAYGDVDLPGLGMFCGALVVAYAAAGFTNFFLRRQFVADAVFAVMITVTIAFAILHYIPREAAGGWRIPTPPQLIGGSSRRRR